MIFPNTSPLKAAEGTKGLNNTEKDTLIKKTGVIMKLKANGWISRAIMPGEHVHSAYLRNKENEMSTSLYSLPYFAIVTSFYAVGYDLF